MLNNAIDGVLDELTFSTESDEFGRQETVDLVPNGRTIEVTDDNKVEYIDCMADFILTRSIQRQIDAFLSGFREMIPSSLLIFNENELELLLCGLPDIDLHDLQNNIEYRGYKPADQTVQWFWQIAHDLTQQEKALLMLFVTGTSKIPLEGFKALQGANGVNPFTIQKGDGTDALPISHTCLTGDHAVLTRSGWRSIKTIVVGDVVASIHVGINSEGEEVEHATYELQWKKVTDVQSPVVRADAENHRLFRLQGKGVDIIATHDHRMLVACVASRKPQLRRAIGYETVGQLLDHQTWESSSSASNTQYTGARAVLRSAINKQQPWKVVIPKMTAVCEWWWAKDKQMAFLRFLGFWLSDGMLIVTDGYVAVGQRKLEATSWLIDLLDEVFPRGWTRCSTADYDAATTHRYIIRCPPLFEWLRAMAAGPQGYNPMDPTAVRSYPHFLSDAELARREFESSYGRPRTAGTQWTEAAMLDALAPGSLRRPCYVCNDASGVRLSCNGRCCAHVDDITCAHPACVILTCGDQWSCPRCVDENDPLRCLVCRHPHGTDDNDLLLCDGEGCERCMHVQCAGLTVVPEGDWLCRVCKYNAEASLPGVLETAMELETEPLTATSASKLQRRASAFNAAAQSSTTVVADYGAKPMKGGTVAAPVVAVGSQPSYRVVWNGGVFDIDIDSHWFYRKRWMGSDVADTFANLSQQQATALLEGFCRADGVDGHVHFDHKTGEPAKLWQCSNSSRPLIDHLQLIGQLAGAGVTLNRHSKAGQVGNINGRQVVGKVERWQLSFNFREVVTSAAGPQCPPSQACGRLGRHRRPRLLRVRLQGRRWQGVRHHRGGQS